MHESAPTERCGPEVRQMRYQKDQGQGVFFHIAVISD